MALLSVYVVMFQHTAARRRLELRRWWKLRRWWFQHTAARRRLVPTPAALFDSVRFQHTAARRRLAIFTNVSSWNVIVSTHSRPKAAGTSDAGWTICNICFNTQPPEGGWSLSQKPCSIKFRSPDFAKLTRKA